MQNKDKETFSYTYSAKEQAEIQKIRDKYEKPTAEEDKMTQLRRLDASVHSKATAVSLALGIIGALIMGCGMSLIMTDIGAILGMPVTAAMLIGVPIGIVGMVLVCLAYPVYNRTVKKEREKIAPEIIRLADELMK